MPTDTSSPRIILINGATGALGQALARHWTQTGNQLVLLGRDANRLDHMAERLTQQNPEQPPIIQPVDLSGAAPEDYQTLHDALAESLGKLDVFVNAMGQPGNPTPLAKADLMDFQTTVHVNFTAVFALARSLFDLLEQGDNPSMLFFTDRGAPAYTGAYPLAHQALARLIDQWSREQSKVRVLGFDPGPVASSLRQKHFPGEHPHDRRQPEQAISALTEWFDQATSGEIMRLDRPH